MKCPIFKKKTFRINHYILIALLALFFIFEVSIWIASDGFPAMADQIETYTIYATGKNFVKYGIVKLRFIDDCATSSSEAAHPFYYTHMPNFPKYFTYLLQKIGIKSIPAQLFIMIFISGVGLFYMYLTVKEYIKSEQAALFVLAVSVFNYAGVLIRCLNLLRGWTWLVVFGVLYYLKKYDSKKKSHHFWVGILFCFLMAYFDYGVWLFFILVIIFLKFLGFYNRLTWKRLGFFLMLGSGIAFVLHLTFVVWAIGFETFFKDYYYTFWNRLTGSPSRMEMIKFYESKGLLLWGVPPFSWVERTYLAKRRLFFLFGSLLPFVVFIFYLICTTELLISKLSVLIKTKHRYYLYFKIKRLFRFLIVKKYYVRFFIALFTPIIMFAFMTYGEGMYFWGSAPLVVFPITIAEGLILSSLVTDIYKYIKQKNTIIALILFIIFISFIGYLIKIPYIHVTKDLPVMAMPGHKVLRKYKGYSFVGNSHAAYMSYFTDEWANTRFSLDKNFDQTDFLFERDKFINREKYKKPDFLFINFIDRFGSEWNGEDIEKIFNDYPLVEKGENFWIFDLRKN